MTVLGLIIATLLVWGFNPQGQQVSEQGWETGDFNFDGYEDYRVEAENPGNQCGWFEYYLFDSAAEAHTHVDTPFCKEVFDSQTRTVKTSLSGGMAGFIYLNDEYEWDGLKLVHLRREQQQYDRERGLFIRTVVEFDDRFLAPRVETRLYTPEELGYPLQ